MEKVLSVLTLFISSVLLGGIQTALAFSLDCSEYKGCERKFCEIEKQITIAKSKENSEKVKGLNIALKKSKSNCSVKSLKDELTSKISEVENEILGYENDLKEAKEDEKPKKIKKYNDKITDEKIKLESLKAELKALK
jgi:vacuolar-type H+-ATPase subunit I/STV1